MNNNFTPDYDSKESAILAANDIHKGMTIKEGFVALKSGFNYHFEAISVFDNGEYIKSYSFLPKITF